MLASHNTKARSAFITANIAALLIAFSPNLHAQSPLTVQPSTGRVGVGNTSPAEALDVTGNIKNSGTLDVAGNIKNNGSLSVGSTAQTGTANRLRHLNSIVTAIRTTDQIVYDSTFTLVTQPDTELVDTDAIHDTATNPGRLTAPLTGKYAIFGSIAWDSNGSGDRHVSIQKNSGGTYRNTAGSQLGGVSIGAASALLTQMNVAAIASLSSGDYVELCEGTWGGA